MTSNPLHTSPPRPSARIAAALLLALASAGCAPSPDEAVGVAAQAFLNLNSLDPAALDPSALSALGANALSPGAMAPGAMSALQDPSAAGDLSRELLLYTVSCAFTPAQSLGFSWTDSAGTVHAESYPGLLGLAPSWAAQALDSSGQQWVSDCLASRVNAEGVAVMLSSRGTAAALATTASERSAYQTREAVFFGNLFASPSSVYVCYDPLSVLPSQMQNRVCSEPEILEIGLLPTAYDCGPIAVIGPCVSVLGLLMVGFCAQQDSVDRYLYDCAPGSGPTIPSITTFLQGRIPW